MRVLEVSSSPDDTSFRQGHIPGAIWWFWKDALWHPTDREFITPEGLSACLGNLGIAPQITVVLYGTPVQFGTYAFWILAMAGHHNLRLLDGGKKRWSAEARPLTRDEPDLPPVAYLPGEEDRSSRIGRDDIRGNLGRPGRLLLDVRSPEEYRGERVSPPTGEVHFDLDHGAERAGRIPGARHLYFRKLVNEDDTFLPEEKIRQNLAESGVDLDGGEETVTYCRLSHRATLVWFAMYCLLGVEQVRVYDGSWTEWGSLVGFPIEK